MVDSFTGAKPPPLSGQLLPDVTQGKPEAFTGTKPDGVSKSLREGERRAKWLTALRDLLLDYVAAHPEAFGHV